MILANNVKILKKVFPTLLSKIKEIEDDLDENLVKLEVTKQDQKTLTIERDNKLVYLHSKYNPKREAEAIIEKYVDVEDGTSVMFYGTGLGYHIDAFLEKNPNVNYYIYEPVPEILYAYLSNKEIKDLPLKNLKGIVTGNNKKYIYNFLGKFIDKSAGKVMVVSLPTHRQIFQEYYKEFLDLYKEVTKGKRNSMVTEYAFQKRWTINSMKNFKEVLSTPNILIEKKGQFKGKPALLVAAGPSLNEEIENIRYIKKNGLAYIFSVGSAVNTLVHHNIYPDAACTYDPQGINQNVFKKVRDMGITEIPLFFGSSVGFETLENYPGHKYHMITSQDTVSSFYLKTVGNEKIESVYDAPSIAVVTLQALYHLGFDTIILAGQNLAYKDKERYSEGIYYSTDVTEKEVEDGVWVTDVYGKEILTNEGFNSMRKQIELYIKEFDGLNVINTTKDGAHIEGTAFMELKEVIKRHLTEQSVEMSWLDCHKTKYDTEHLLSQSKKMDKEHKDGLKLIEEFYSILDSIKIFIKNKSFNQAEKMYIKLDKALSKIEKNKFFITFIIPMNRLNYKTLTDSIDSLNEEKDKTLKGERIVNGFKNFMDMCNEDIEVITPIYEEFKEFNIQ